MCEERRNGVAHLDVLLRARPVKEVVVRKRLETRHFSHGETPALTRIWMNEVVAVLRQVARDGCARAIGELHAVAVVEIARVPVRVAGHERHGEVEGLRRSPEGTAERRREQVTGQIRGHVRPGLVVGQRSQLRVEDPLPEILRAARGQERLATRIATRWRGPVRRGESAGKSPSEPGCLVVRHRRLIRGDEGMRRSHRILPGAGIVASAETAAKPWHRADDEAERHGVGVRLESRQVLLG